MEEYNYYNESELQSQSQLVLFIEELSKDNYSIIKRRLFIGWDKDNLTFFIRGRVYDELTVPFSFKNDSMTSVYDFVKFIFYKNPVNIVLYNYNNLCDKDIDSLPYEFFEYLLEESHEISGYDADVIQFKRFMRLLKLLKM